MPTPHRRQTKTIRIAVSFLKTDRSSTMTTKKALIVWGGWDGHQPKQCADKVADAISTVGFSVEFSDTLDVFLDAEKLASMNVIIPSWTCGQITGEQSAGLCKAIADGVGLAGWHGGMCDAFRGDTNYQFMTGGQWVAHPDNTTPYTVNIVPAKASDPIVAGLKDFNMLSEQYYMHTDPSNEVLATTTFNCKDAPWVNGCVMPVVWKRMWGKGRVFYSALGHIATDFDGPEVLEIQKRGTVWAAR
jgi:type 1 glutamine amidotransferase